MIKNYFYMCHPCSVLMYFFGAVFLSMFVSGPILTGVSLGCVLICRTYACGFGAFLSSVKTAMPIVLLMSILNPILYSGGLTVMFTFFSVTVTKEALVCGLSSGMMLASVILWFALLNDMAITDELLSVFSGIAPTFVLVVCMILRYIPQMIKSANATVNAYHAMFHNGKMRKKRWKASVRNATVVFTKSLEDSVETARSMNARGYGERGRHIAKRSLRHADKINFILVCLFLSICMAALFFCKRFVFYPYMEIPKHTIIAAVVIAVFFLLPVLIDGKDALKCILLK